MFLQCVCPRGARSGQVRAQYVYLQCVYVCVVLTGCTDLANFIFFQAFLLYIHYMRENAERRLYTLRDQLKVSYRATQKAQVNERKAADSKRRLTRGGGDGERDALRRRGGDMGERLRR